MILRVVIFLYVLLWGVSELIELGSEPLPRVYAQQTFQISAKVEPGEVVQKPLR